MNNKQTVWERYQEYLKNRKPTVKLLSKCSCCNKRVCIEELITRGK